MSAAAVARSSFLTSIRRYSRSTGLWLLLLVAPVGARFMIADDQGSGITIAVGGHLPVMTSATLGVSLGIVVSTLLLPIGFLYLRSNVTRRQPWQVEEVTTGSRVAIMLGRFGADVAVLFAMLAALTLAGWFLGWLIVTGPLDPGQITLALWIVAAPALMGLAAIRLLFDALPFARRGWGDFLYFLLWMASITAPIIAVGQASSFATNMLDFPGFMRPMVAGSPDGSDEFAIGGADVLPGRVPLDVMRGLSAPGYASSRLTWAAISMALVILAGLVYRPHVAPRRNRGSGRLARLLAAGPPPAADRAAPPAASVRQAIAGLIAAEFRLIGRGRAFRLLALAAAALGLFGDFRHIGSPAGLILLVFGLAAHAGRSEARGLLALTATALLPPMARRAAFVVAGAGWATLLALPAALVRLSPEPLLLGLATGTGAALIAIVLATASRSAFAPRLVLLILWYGYLSA
jgi:hypothetical protein